MRGDERKLQILKSALAVIGSDGIAGLTVAKIAEKTGVSEAALYRHFKGKDDILSNCIDLIKKNLLGTIAGIREEPMEPLERLRKIYFIHIDHIQANPGIPRIIYTSEIHSNDEFRKRLNLVIDKYIKEVEAIVQEGVSSGSIGRGLDVGVLARNFLSLIQFTAFRLSLTGFHKRIVKEGSALWDGFERQIGA